MDGENGDGKHGKRCPSFYQTVKALQLQMLSGTLYLGVINAPEIEQRAPQRPDDSITTVALI
jgi:hypothetical protein